MKIEIGTAPLETKIHANKKWNDTLVDVSKDEIYLFETKEI